MLSHDTVRKKIEATLMGLLVLIAISYGIIKTYPLYAGPYIEIYNPHDGDTVSSSTFEISGKVLRAKEISIQGRLIPIGTDGHFAEVLVANPPYTILVLRATDTYGTTKIKTLRVIPQ